MNRIFCLTLLMAVFAGGVQAATAPDMPTPVQSIETGTEAVSLPRTVGGMASVRNSSCADCKAVSLRLTEKTKLFVGKQEVTLAEFNKFLEQTLESRQLIIFYATKSRDMTRVRVAGELAKRPVRSGK